MERQGLRYYPIALFSSVMGFAVVTIAVPQLELIYVLNHIVSTIFVVATTLLFLLNGGILIYRLIRYRDDVIKDFNHPIKMNFFATISISLLLLAVVYINLSPDLSFVLWVVGTLMQLSLTLIILNRMTWRTSVKLAHFTPVSFIPIVGNLVVPLAGSHHVDPHINWFFFGIGVFFSIVYMTIFINRIFFHAPLPSPLVPTIFIMLAPPSVGFVSYMSIAGELNGFAYMLYAIACFIGLFLIIQLKRVFTGSFSVSAWALLFPSGAITIATIQMSREVAYVFYEWLAMIQIIGLLLLVTYLSWGTIQLARRGSLCMPDG